MTRRKYVVHENAADRERSVIDRNNSRSKPKDTSLSARAKVSQIYITKKKKRKEILH